ncbi:MAG: FG-GAP-like repeat-containing protein, partial [Terriglobales bacterium]
MKRALFLYLFLCLTTFLSSQLNPIPPVNRKAGVVPPINAPQLPSTRIRAATRRTNPLQTAALSFAPSVVYFSGGEFTTSVAVADVNGDGKPDLLLTNYGSGVAVLLGNGDGTFQAAVNYGAGTNFVAVGDVNGDGKPDLVVAGGGEGSVSVLLGNGDGTFQAAVSYGSGGYEATSVAVADVDGDGKPDLLVANSCAGPPDALDICEEGGSVGVLRGNGDGTFQSAVNYSSGAATFDTMSLAVADVNGDGKPDLLVANDCITDSDYPPCTNDTVGVLLGNGDGTFQAVVSYGAGGSFTHSVAVADVDGDGKPDLVVADECVNSSNCYNGIVGVLLGNGDGTFQTALTYGSGGDAGANLVTVADVNGDGKPDIEVAIGCFGCNNGSVGVLINTSVSSATTALTSSSNPSSIGQAVTFAATVTSQGFKIMPTGTVSFFDGTKTFGTVELNGNVANITTSGLSIGTHSITAVYSGDSNFIGSSSNTLKQLVQGAYGVVSPTTENFGPILIGQTSTQRLISLKNTGGSELTISSISISGDFALPVNRCAEGVKPSTHCNVEITFTPHTPGTQTGTLTFTDNAPNSPQTVSLTGTGSNVASTTTTLSSSPNPSTFGE